MAASMVGWMVAVKVVLMVANLVGQWASVTVGLKVVRWDGLLVG
jgi:hypothetical protein